MRQLFIFTTLYLAPPTVDRVVLRAVMGAIALLFFHHYSPRSLTGKNFRILFFSSDYLEIKSITYSLNSYLKIFNMHL